MNAIRCPNCSAINQTSAISCHVCGISLANLPSTAYVSMPADQLFPAPAYGRETGHLDLEVGRKTFFWYRVYCGAMVGLYLLVAALGAFVLVVQPDSNQHSAQEQLFIGVAYAFLGVILALVYAIALFLPAKSYNWIVGIIAISLGLTSCCLLPALIPLLIFWVKPETKAFFGRT